MSRTLVSYNSDASWAAPKPPSTPPLPIRYKGICRQRATEAGIATARLPITKYVKLADRAVLTVNHVVHIMVEMFNRRNWKEVLDIVLPPRKRADFKKAKHAKNQNVGELDPSPISEGAEVIENEPADEPEAPNNDETVP